LATFSARLTPPSMLPLSMAPICLRRDQVHSSRQSRM
jgi:hypothetical protein